jgi:hypothetical protein
MMNYGISPLLQTALCYSNIYEDAHNGSYNILGYRTVLSARPPFVAECLFHKHNISGIITKLCCSKILYCRSCTLVETKIFIEQDMRY